LFAAAAARFTKAATSFLRFGSLDERERLARIGPLNHPLVDLGPDLALSLDQKRIDPNLASRGNAGFVERLLIGEDAKRLRADLPSDACFLERLAGRRLRRPQPLDRPSLRDDPPPRLPRRYEQNFERGLGGESIGKRAVLDADRRFRLSLRLAGDARAPDSCDSKSEIAVATRSARGKSGKRNPPANAMRGRGLG
jgi:hypothetical protein